MQRFFLFSFFTVFRDSYDCIVIISLSNVPMTFSERISFEQCKKKNINPLSDASFILHVKNKLKRIKNRV